jgi:hypothetical protein
MRLFFLHIPKTAGQSFRKAAIEFFGKDAVFLLYGKDKRKTTPLVYDIYYQDDKLSEEEKFTKISDAMIEHKIQFFSSHASATLLPSFNPKESIVFFREPISRILSHYNYAIKKGHFCGTLEDFIEDPHYQNIQSALLCGMDINEIGFIGITEEYKKSIELFNKMFNVRFKVFQKNKMYTFFGYKNKKNIDDKLKQKIELYNQQDFILYKKALEIYDNRLRKYNV